MCHRLLTVCEQRTVVVAPPEKYWRRRFRFSGVTLKKAVGGRNLLAYIASTAHSPWLPVCICGKHMQSGDVSVERSTWKPVDAVVIPSSDWQVKPRKKVTYVLDTDVSADTSTDTESER